MITCRLKYLLFTVLLVSGFSCSDDDSYPLSEYQVDLCTVFLSNDDCYFRLDNGRKLFPENMSVDLQNRLENDMRARIRYKILSDDSSLIHLYDAAKINLSGILSLTEDNVIQFGNDPIGLESLWIGGNYLNLSFYFYANTEVHYISLVKNTIITYPDDGTVHLEIRHNANNDFPAYRKRGIVSFDIGSLKNKEEELLNIEIKVNTYNDGEKCYSRMYEF